MFFNASVEWPGCFANVVAAAAAADVVDDTFGLLRFCGVFLTVCPNDGFEGCGCGEIGVDACFVF